MSTPSIHGAAAQADARPEPATADTVSASEHHARLMDAAKAEAARLRSQAVREFGCGAFDDFWRGANAVWQRMEDASTLAARSANRLQARLVRRHPPKPLC